VPSLEGHNLVDEAEVGRLKQYDVSLRIRVEICFVKEGVMAPDQVGPINEVAVQNTYVPSRKSLRHTSRPDIRLLG
jgi:hypothetical protein